jgi:hypothetical protein
MVDAELRRRIPLGLGFVGGRFEAHIAEEKMASAYQGVCLKCRKQGVFEAKKPDWRKARIVEVGAKIRQKLERGT